MKRLNKKGFTLVELLVVIVILAVIMSIAIPSIIPTNLFAIITKIPQNYPMMMTSSLMSVPLRDPKRYKQEMQQ